MFLVNVQFTLLLSAFSCWGVQAGINFTLNASFCDPNPSRPIISRPPKPTRAPTKAPTRAPAIVPGACKNINTMCVSTDTCCAPNVCRAGLNSTMYCQPQCSKALGEICNSTTVCCNGNVCRVNASSTSTTLRCMPPCKNMESMCNPSVDICCDNYYKCVANATTPTVGKCKNTFCTCGDKSSSIEGEGKVTGGGWIYLTNKTFLNSDMICGQGACCASSFKNIFAGGVLNQLRANYGFNAMWRKGLPHGSTNFDFEGACFHFHSDTGKIPYRYLEVVDPVHARWWGMGRVASKLNPRKNDWVDDFCFMVAVQDHGEPGADDTWRLRIWRCSGCFIASGENDPMLWTGKEWDDCADDQSVLLFDTNYVPYYAGGSIHSGLVPNPPLVGGQIRTSDRWTYYNYSTIFPGMSANAGNDPLLYRFNGTNVGELTANGGGNIQIHKFQVRNKYLTYLESVNGTCNCLTNLTDADKGDNGFVTGGGWIYLDEQAYLKPVSNCGCVNAATKRYDTVMNDEACYVNSVVGAKATYGFNAKYIGGVPQGNTNFVIHNLNGTSFHFKSVRMTTITPNRDYDGLEVVCDNTYGPSGNGVFARWTGIGSVARAGANAATPADSSSSWVTGYRFYVAVQDNGEPGLADTFRLRIEDTIGCNKTLLFDTDVNAGPVYLTDFSCVNADANCLSTNPGFPDFTGISFNGTEAGFVDAGKAGGGNVQIHCKGGPS